jgi:hypothetical protein
VGVPLTTEPVGDVVLAVLVVLEADVVVEEDEVVEVEELVPEVVPVLVAEVLVLVELDVSGSPDELDGLEEEVRGCSVRVIELHVALAGIGLKESRRASLGGQ